MMANFARGQRDRAMTTIGRNNSLYIRNLTHDIPGCIGPASPPAGLYSYWYAYRVANWQRNQQQQHGPGLTAVLYTTDLDTTVGR